MLAINNNPISHLNLVTSNRNNKRCWLDIRSTLTADEITQEYKSICKEFHNDDKWVLIVNPENDSLDQLAITPNVNQTKILQVHSHKVNVSIKNIQTALNKGNCSVVVLNNVSLCESDLVKLKASAQKGHTKCIILNNKSSLH